MTAVGSPASYAIQFLKTEMEEMRIAMYLHWAELNVTLQIKTAANETFNTCSETAFWTNFAIFQFAFFWYTSQEIATHTTLTEKPLTFLMENPDLFSQGSHCKTTVFFFIKLHQRIFDCTVIEVSRRTNTWEWTFPTV